MIAGVNKVFLFVDDQDAAKEFWTKTVGLPLHLDSEECPGAGWVEVVTPDRRTILILAQRPEGMPSTSGQLSHVAFYAEDIYLAKKQLQEKGVEFTEEISEQHWGLSTTFKDVSGTLFNLGQRTPVVTNSAE